MPRFAYRNDLDAALARCKQLERERDAALAALLNDVDPGPLPSRPRFMRRLWAGLRVPVDSTVAFIFVFGCTFAVLVGATGLACEMQTASLTERGAACRIRCAPAKGWTANGDADPFLCFCGELKE